MGDNNVVKLEWEFEGWKDKTRALKEELKRQSEANELFFVKNAKEINLAEIQESASNKYTFGIMGMTGAAVVNLLRRITMEYRETDSGPYFLKFAADKKFKVELMPTALHPGHGLIKVVGRLKYYTYPEMCSLLARSGVTSKGLGDMTYKLNTKGMKSALFNAVSPMNELHFMLLFEIARRLVRDSDGKSMSTDPALDLLPVGVIIGRIIELLRVEKDAVLSYEKVFGDQQPLNWFTEPNTILKRQKMTAINKMYFEKFVKGQQDEVPFIRRFLEENKNGYIIKTLKGYLDDLKEVFGEM
ncbi:uncharacterized protein LOC144637823 [Oculina patagonica]